MLDQFDTARLPTAEIPHQFRTAPPFKRRHFSTSSPLFPHLFRTGGELRAQMEDGEEEITNTRCACREISRWRRSTPQEMPARQKATDARTSRRVRGGYHTATRDFARGLGFLERVGFALQLCPAPRSCRPYAVAMDRSSLKSVH